MNYRLIVDLCKRGAFTSLIIVELFWLSAYFTLFMPMDVFTPSLLLAQSSYGLYGL